MKPVANQPDLELREAVTRQIAKVIYDGNKAGEDGMRLARATFPGTPESVMGEAIWIAEEQTAEEWWRMVESTIDTDVVKAAVALVDQQQHPKRE